MEFDIIELTEEELKKLNTAQMQLLRTAQKKKNALVHKAEREYEAFREKVMTAGLKNSSLLNDKKSRLDADVEYECSIIIDDLLYNMELRKPMMSGGNGADDPGYLVDYSLSYNERYVIVRDYYLAIKDPDERMALYAADEVAKKYLGTYYKTLYNVLATYSK